MTLAELSQMAAAVGTIASITYAAIQIRNNARALRAASVQQLNLSILTQWDEMARNRELLMVMLKGGDDFEQLDRWDKARVRFFILAHFRRYEVAFFQHQIGNITNEDWKNIFMEIEVSITQPGLRTAWGLIRNRIGPKFRAVVDAMAESESQKAKAAPVAVTAAKLPKGKLKK